MTVDQNRLYSTTDAQVWAEEFMAEFGGERRDDIDEGLMIGWFANAFATADTHNREKNLADRLARALILTQEYVGSDVLPPIEGWSWFDALSDYYGEPFVPADRRPVEPDSNEVPVAAPPDA